MKKKTLIGLCLALCLLLALPAALAQTRQGVIAREGEEETVEETLFESSLGFSFWYASDWLEAYYGEEDNIEGAVVRTIYSDDYMVLSMITQEEAEEYTGDLEGSISDEAVQARVQKDVYLELTDGRYCFLTVIAENGRYLLAAGEYWQDAAEGNAQFFQRVLDSVTFAPGCLFRAEWGDDSADGEGYANVLLTALGPVTDAALLRLEWNDVSPTWEQAAPLGSFSLQQTMNVRLQFIGDLPNNGVMYTDEAGVAHAFALDLSGEDGSLFFWELEE